MSISTWIGQKDAGHQSQAGHLHRFLQDRGGLAPDSVADRPGGGLPQVPAVIKRIRYLFRGSFRVEFRPFIYRTAQRHRLSGWVQNRADGVWAEVEGTASALAAFKEDVISNPPPLAEVAISQAVDLLPTGEGGFKILESEGGEARKVHIAPDIAVCDDAYRIFNP